MKTVGCFLSEVAGMLAGGWTDGHWKMEMLDMAEIVGNEEIGQKVDLISLHWGF